MPELTIGQAIGRLAAERPDAVAVRCGDEVLTRRALDLVTNRMARAWIRGGVGPDDLVSVCLPSSADVVLACVAAWKAGATPQPLSPSLPAAEREAVLALARPALVIDPTLGAAVDRHEGGSEAPLPPLAASSWKAPTSSGSTGGPKLVRAAAPARIDPDRQVAPYLPRSAVQLVAAPLVHAAPFVYAMRGLMTGHELVVMPEFDAPEWLRLVERHRVTWGMLVPSMMLALWRTPGRADADVGSLESVLHLGASCATWLKRDWLGWLGPDRVDEVYAGTEAQGLTWIRGREWLDHPGSVGRPVGGTELLVVRPDGTTCDTGETGEVLMRRDRPTYTYLGAEPVVRDGWHTLGDAGWLDADGYLHLAGRLDDVVVSGGVPVHPADVESVLEGHPSVRAAVVVGRPDEVLGEHLHAVVEGEVAVADLEAFAATRLPADRRPVSWEVVSTALRDGAGKVRRSAWRTAHAGPRMAP